MYCIVYIVYIVLRKSRLQVENVLSAFRVCIEERALDGIKLRLFDTHEYFQYLAAR